MSNLKCLHVFGPLIRRGLINVDKLIHSAKKKKKQRNGEILLKRWVAATCFYLVNMKGDVLYLDG